MSQIHPVHHSLRTSQKKPKNMDRVGMSEDTHRALTSVALSIFTDAVNVGNSFQDALLSVYLSGLEHGTKG